MSETTQHVRLHDGRAYEIETEQGSSLYIDRRSGDSRWLLIPGPGQDGSVVLDLDRHLLWKRLSTLEPLGGALSGEWTGEGWEDDGFVCVARIGHPVQVYTGLTEYWTSTTVTSVRELEGAELSYARSYDDDDELDLLDDESEPGTYSVFTQSGSRYVVTINPDRPAMIGRIGAHELSGDREVIPVRAMRFQVGQNGEYWSWKVRPEDRTAVPDEAYTGSLRQLTTVVAVKRQRWDEGN